MLKIFNDPLITFIKHLLIRWVVVFWFDGLGFELTLSLFLGEGLTSQRGTDILLLSNCHDRKSQI